MEGCTSSLTASRAARARQERGGMDETTASTAVSSRILAELVERHQWALWAFLRGFVGDEAARDLTQDAFYDAVHAAQRGIAPFSATGVDMEGARRWLFNA